MDEYDPIDNDVILDLSDDPKYSCVKRGPDCPNWDGCNQDPVECFRCIHLYGLKEESGALKDYFILVT
jgi:hypothetical protein